MVLGLSQAVLKETTAVLLKVSEGVHMGTDEVVVDDRAPSSQVQVRLKLRFAIQEQTNVTEVFGKEA